MRHTVALTVAATALTLATTAAYALPACEEGMHVDKATALNYPGTILEVDHGKGAYKVRMDDGDLEWMSANELKWSCEGEPSGARSTDFYVGEWSLFIMGPPHYEERGDDIYLVVEQGAAADPVQIHNNGTYSWQTSQGVIEGHWDPLPQGQDKYHYGTPAILLSAGEGGHDWQMWSKGGIAADGREQVTLERWDLGTSYLASRME